MTAPDLDVLAVACPDCHSPAGAPCIGDTHAARRETAEIRATLREGTCTYPHPGGPCARRLVTYRLYGELVALHPDPLDAAACPPLADPLRDHTRWAEQVNAGLAPGHPGIGYFRPLAVCPECVNGKHVNCTGWALRADDTVACECPEVRP